MREPLDINKATLRGILILTIVTVLAVAYFVWWGQHLGPLPQDRPIPAPQAQIQGSAAIDDFQYLLPRRVRWATPTGTVTVPLSFALEFNDIILCESSWNPDAVGDAGERGLFQVHPIHDNRMARMGLDPQVERDRMIMAVALWRERGTRPWSCG